MLAMTLLYVSPARNSFIEASNKKFTDKTYFFRIKKERIFQTIFRNSQGMRFNFEIEIIFSFFFFLILCSTIYHHICFSCYFSCIILYRFYQILRVTNTYWNCLTLKSAFRFAFRLHCTAQVSKLCFWKFAIKPASPWD